MSEGLTPVEIFCLYAHEDEGWLHKLETHLSLLKRQGLISFWYDRLISPGTNWAQAIDNRLEAASIILLLVSADFFTSDYCYGVEMKRALERQEAGEARVIPIAVRLVDWKDAPFAHLQALPTDAIPIASWPDGDKALANVADGIRRVIVEELPLLQVSAPRASLPSIWNIPYPRNPFFLGRDEDLAHIRRCLQAGQAMAFSQPQAISGLGGIGKTQLALEYAYRYHQDYQAVFWARADNPEALISSYVAFATFLRLPEREAKEQAIIVESVKRWLQTHQGWLLILDNADELATLPSFLPPTLGGHLLVTTRAQATGRLAHRIEIEILSPAQGAFLLLRRSGLLPPDAPFEQALQEEQTLAIQISRELGGLPLALDQAGAYLEETATPLVEYWQVYQEYRADLLRERRGGFVADHPLPVATTWSVSFQRIGERNPGAAELLRLLSWLPADAVAEEVLSAGAAFLGPVLAPIAGSTMLLDQAIGALRAYSLIRRDPRARMLSMHRLVQAVLQDQQDHVERQIWAERAMLTVNAAFPHAVHGTWPQCERLLPHALLAVQYIEIDHIVSEEAGHLLNETASYLEHRARYREAELLYRRVLAIREQQLGLEHPQVAYSLNKLGVLFRTQGKHVEAEPLYLRALAISEQRLGPQHPLVADSLYNLGFLYYVQGKYAEAEPLYLRALAIREQQLGPQHLQVAALLNSMGFLFYLQGKYAEAESLYLRALTIREQQLGPQHPLLAYSLNNLGTLYRKLGKYAEAEAFYLRTLAIREQQLGLQHPQLTYPLNGLATVYRKLGKYAEAEAFYLRSLAISEQQLEPKQPNPYVFHGLAHLYSAQGKYAEAMPLYQRALNIREQYLGPQHPETAEILHDFAHFQEIQGNISEALPLYQRALVIRERVLGLHHHKTRETQHCLLPVLQELGHHEEAIFLQEMLSKISTIEDKG